MDSGKNTAISGEHETVFISLVSMGYQWLRCRLTSKRVIIEPQQSELSESASRFSMRNVSGHKVDEFSSTPDEPAFYSAWMHKDQSTVRLMIQIPGSTPAWI